MVRDLSYIAAGLEAQGEVLLAMVDSLVEFFVSSVILNKKRENLYNFSLTIFY